MGYSYNTRVAIRRLCDVLALKPGDAILGPAYNCGSELDPFREAGIKVHLYDVGPAGELDIKEIRQRISSQTKAIYFTHYFGFLQTNAKALRKLCDAAAITLIEDCALSLLSGETATRGTTGDAAVFCFYKFFPVLGGGAMVFNNPGLGEAPAFEAKNSKKDEVKSLIRAGINTFAGKSGSEALRRKRARQSVAEPPAEFPDMPSSYYFDPNLTDARISPVTMRAAKSFNTQDAVTRRRSNFQTCLRLLEDVPQAKPLYPELPANICPLNMPVMVEGRNAIAQALASEGIAAVPWWAGYNRHFDYSASPNARRLKDNVLALPLHQQLDAKHIELIVGKLRALLA